MDAGETALTMSKVRHRNKITILMLLLVFKSRPKRKVFDQLTKYGKRKALRDIRGLFKLKEVEYRTPVSRMAGFLIMQVSNSTFGVDHKQTFICQDEHLKNRKLSQLGSAIASGAASNLSTIPLDQALYLMSYGKLSKVGYTTMRLAMLPLGVGFPTYDEVSAHKSSNVVPTKLV